MSLSVTVKHIKAVAAILGQQYDTVEEAAEAAIEEAWRQYEARGNWIVAGQVKFTDGRYVSPDDGRADKVALGPYATRGQAETAGRSLALAAGTGEQFVWWALQIHHGTPSQLHKARQAERKAAALEAAPDQARIDEAKRFSSTQPGWPQEQLEL